MMHSRMHREALSNAGRKQTSRGAVLGTGGETFLTPYVDRERRTVSLVGKTYNQWIEVSEDTFKFTKGQLGKQTSLVKMEGVIL